MERLKLSLYNHRMIISIIVIIVILALLYIFYFRNKIEKEDIIINEDIKEEVVIESIPIYIDIKGSINKAGGLKEEADTSLLNLSMKLHDEMYIYIYTKEEVLNFVKVVEDKNHKIDECQKTNEICIDKEVIKKDDVINNKLNINKASIEELKLLPGIGEAKAQLIIDYRNTKGVFNDINDIKNVSGIGDSLFDKIKDLITV